jgi:hypothetical protein
MVYASVLPAWVIEDVNCGPSPSVSIVVLPTPSKHRVVRASQLLDAPGFQLMGIGTQSPAVHVCRPHQTFELSKINIGQNGHTVRNTLSVSPRRLKPQPGATQAFLMATSPEYPVLFLLFVPNPELPRLFCSFFLLPLHL